jgi:RNA polymerase sigma-70 factor, ECF subfamily
VGSVRDGTPMSEDSAEQDLVVQAVAGDPSALERLLLAHYERLATHIAHRLPQNLRAVIAPEDVLQETFVCAFREIGRFTPREPSSFYNWLATIAEHRLSDLVKAQRAAKRGGGRVAVPPTVKSDAESLVGLLELLCVSERTPSRSAAGHEAVGAVQVALAGLRDDYREVLRLRYIENLPAADIAQRMGRTEHAVHMLCHRALEELRAALGRSSQFLTRK